MEEIVYVAEDGVTVYVDETGVFTYIAGFVPIIPPGPQPPNEAPFFPDHGRVNVSAQYALDIVPFIDWEILTRRR